MLSSQAKQHGDAEIGRKFPPVDTLLLHEPPMRLVDEVVGELPSGIVCKTTISPKFVFLRDGEVDALVCVELVAQAVACYVGLAEVRENQAPRGGLIVGCRDARFHVERLRLGDELLIRASRTWIRHPAASFSGEVSRNGTILATVELAVIAGVSIEDFGTESSSDGE
jgi:predicted hotdog family 3-hydroxylacyl-ACP dehydratase